ncbi:energy transducer TonB [Sphingomonas sp. YL-JM2C]
MLIKDRTEARRWGSSLAVVLAAHAAPALVAAYWLGPMVSTPAPEPAIMIDMEPPAAPPVPPSQEPPGQKQVKADVPRPKVQDDPVKTPPVPHPAVAIPVAPPQPPQIEAKQAAPDTAAPPAHPLPPAPTVSSGKMTWQGLVLGQLEKFKRYPWEAQGQRQQGVPYIRFVMNRDGKVLSSRLERSSGFSALDSEAVSLPKRAQPLPKPPADVIGDTIELVVPVQFYLH